MRRLLGSLAVVAAGVAGVYWLMVWDAHYMLLAAFGPLAERSPAG